MKAARHNGKQPQSGRVKPAPGRLPDLPAWLLIIPAILGLIFAFGNAIGGPFIFDDLHLPFQNPQALQMPARFWIGGVRPLLMATYWANFRLSGLSTQPFHVTNLVLHFLVAALLFFNLRRIGTLAGAGRNWSPWFGAGVFLLHPLQTESVDYIAGRSEILCAIFVLLAWLLFLRYFDTLPTLPAIGILSCAAAAVLSKESGVWLAPLLVATDIYWNKQGLLTQFRRKATLYAIGVAGLLVAVVVIFRRLAGSTTAGFSGGVSPWAYALTQCRSIFTYLRLFLWPAGQSLDWRQPLLHSLWKDGAWLYFIGILVVICAIVLLYSRMKLVSFGLLAFLLALAPTSSFIPIQDTIAERRMYLPIAALIIAVLGLAGRLPINQWARNSVFAVLLVGLAVTSHNRSVVWTDEVLMWRNVISHDPANARAHSWLGSALALRNDCENAAREFKTAVDIEGLTLTDGTNLATAYECASRPDQALDTWQRLAQVHPNANAFNRIGFLEAVRNQVQPSLNAFDEALRLDPNNATAFAYRGTANMALNHIAAARQDFRRALAIDPGNAIAISGMGKLPKEP